jgi:uncharacterized membrane protein
VNQFTASLWGDEGFSAILSMKSLPEIIKTIIEDTSPPLWNIFEWAVFRTFGTQEIYIRLLAFIFFLGTIIFTYKIGVFLFDKKTAKIASLLIFLNPFFFTYAFEGRMYSIMALGVAGSMFYFLKRKWVPYVFWTLWALYSHHFAIFPLFAQGIWFIYEFFFGKRKVSISMLKAFVFVAIGYLPWVYPLYLQTGKVGGGFWLGRPDFSDLRNLIYEYLAEGIKSNPIRIFGMGLHQIVLWITLLTLATRKWNTKIKETLFLLSWFLVPILATWTISQKFTPIFFNRYLLYTIPAAMLILASLGRKKITVILLSIIVVIFAVIDWHYFFNPTKIPFRDLAAYVKSTRTDNDFLINEDAGRHKLWEAKYYGIPAPIYSPTAHELPFFVGTALMEEGDIVQEIPPDIKRLGVITFKNADELNFEEFKFEEEKRFGTLNFVWFRKD